MRERAEGRRSSARVVLRRARHADLPGLVDLMRASQSAERGFSPDLGERRFDGWHSRRCFKRDLRQPRLRWWVGCSGARVVAMIGADFRRVNYRHAVTRRYIYVHSLYVSQAWRGRGVARRLVRRALRWGRRCGAQQARIEMAVGNSVAEHLYGSLGFVARERMLTMPLQAI